MNLVSFTFFFGLLEKLVLHHVTFLEIHAVVYTIQLIIDLVKLIHELVCLSFFVFLIAYLLFLDPVFEPLFLLLEIFDFYLLLEE